MWSEREGRKGVWHLFLIEDDSELDSSRAEAVGGLWIEWQVFPGSSRQEDGSPSGLGYPVLPSLEYSKCTLDRGGGGERKIFLQQTQKIDSVSKFTH